MIEIDEDIKSYLHHVVESFSPGICYACAYGSGVFKQSGHRSTKDNMIDFIFVVDDASTWHLQNLAHRNDHYSFLKYFPPKTLARIQTQFGAKVFFNTRVTFNGRLIKYGVIQQDDFITDLLNWDTLYVAGRLHKPVVALKGHDSKQVSNIIQKNLKSAVETSLLILPEEFTAEELYLQIAGLSYTGDFRMIVGEDKNKIRNIVLPSMHRFTRLYEDVVERNPSVYVKNGRLQQDKAYNVQLNYVNDLPLELRKYLYRCVGANDRMDFNSNDTRLKSLIENHTALRECVTTSIKKIVGKSSVTQTIKGIFTAGLSKSVMYSSEKIVKMLKSIPK